MNELMNEPTHAHPLRVEVLEPDYLGSNFTSSHYMSFSKLFKFSVYSFLISDTNIIIAPTHRFIRVNELTQLKY